MKYYIYGIMLLQSVILSQSDDDMQRRIELLEKTIPASIEIDKNVELKKLFHEEVSVRRDATSALLYFKKLKIEDLPILIKALDDSDQNVRRNIVLLIARMRKDAISIIDILVKKYYQEQDKKVKAAIVTALGNMRTSVVCNEIFHAVNDNNWEVRLSAIYAIDTIPIENREKTTLLFNTLFDENYQVRRATAIVLGEMGEKVKFAKFPLLQLLLNEKERPVQKEVVRALGKIKARETIPILIDLLKDGDLKYATLNSLEYMGPEAIPVLIETFNNGDNEKKIDIIKILGEMGAKKQLIKICNSDLHKKVKKIAKFELETINKVK